MRAFFFFSASAVFALLAVAIYPRQTAQTTSASQVQQVQQPVQQPVPPHTGKKKAGESLPALHSEQPVVVSNEGYPVLRWCTTYAYMLQSGGTKDDRADRICRAAGLSPELTFQQACAIYPSLVRDGKIARDPLGEFDCTPMPLQKDPNWCSTYLTLLSRGAANPDLKADKLCRTILETQQSDIGKQLHSITTNLRGLCAAHIIDLQYSPNPQEACTAYRDCLAQRTISPNDDWNKVCVDKLIPNVRPD